MKTNTDLHEQLPWYVNGSLSAAERQAVEARLAEQPEARLELESWRSLRQEICSQPAAPLPADGLTRLMARVPAAPAHKPVRRFAGALNFFSAALLVISAAILLWLAVQPGVQLQWTAQGPAGGFKVFRAVAGSDHFDQIALIPAQTGAQDYRFVDAFPLPGVTYEYRVQGLTLEGAPALERSIVSGPLAALPGQMAVLLCAVILGLGLYQLAQIWPAPADLRRVFLRL